MLMVWTHEQRTQELTRWVVEKHPYQVPKVMFIPVSHTFMIYALIAYFCVGQRRIRALYGMVRK